MNQSLWYLIKTTLIEKDGSNTVYGSIKRWAGWILLFCVLSMVMTSLMPSMSIHIGSWVWNFEHKEYKVDLPVLKSLLTAIGSYIGIGVIGTTIQNYHNVKYDDGKGDAAKVN